MIFRVNGITIEIEYLSEYNIWVSKVYDRFNCYYTFRRLREGVYDFFNGIKASVNYQGKNPDNGDCVDDAVINFMPPCQIDSVRRNPCG